MILDGVRNFAKWIRNRGGGEEGKRGPGSVDGVSTTTKTRFHWISIMLDVILLRGRFKTFKPAPVLTQTRREPFSQVQIDRRIGNEEIRTNQIGHFSHLAHLP